MIENISLRLVVFSDLHYLDENIKNNTIEN